MISAQEFHQPIQMQPLPLPEPKARPEAPSLNELCARQKPPALLQALHERARWFHEYPTRSSLLLSLEKRNPQAKADCA